MATSETERLEGWIRPVDACKICIFCSLFQICAGIQVRDGRQQLSCVFDWRQFDVVLLVKYAKKLLVEREMPSPFPFRGSRLFSPVHRSICMRMGSGPVARSAFFMAARRSERGPAERRNAISMFGTELSPPTCLVLVSQSRTWRLGGMVISRQSWPLEILKFIGSRE